MWRTANPYDNAHVESFIQTLKRKHVYLHVRQGRHAGERPTRGFTYGESRDCGARLHQCAAPALQSTRVHSTFALRNEARPP